MVVFAKLCSTLVVFFLSNCVLIYTICHGSEHARMPRYPVFFSSVENEEYDPSHPPGLFVVERCAALRCAALCFVSFCTIHTIYFVAQRLLSSHKIPSGILWPFNPFGPPLGEKSTTMVSPAMEAKTFQASPEPSRGHPGFPSVPETMALSVVPSTKRLQLG